MALLYLTGVLKSKGKEINMSMDNQSAALSMLRESGAIYVLISQYTNIPYVQCDPETYDDEVVLFFAEEDAKREMMRLWEEKTPVKVAKIEKKAFLGFYTSLYSMGVNCIRINQGMSRPMAVQLQDLIRRTDVENRPEGQGRIENPQLHLTAIYFVQEFRKGQSAEMSEEVKELNEEMLAHFQRGRYIVAAQENQGLAVLKEKNGQVYQPLFTDIYEFQKFNREKKFKPMVIEAGKLTELVSKESAGIVINPFGVNVRLQMAQNNVKKAR